MRSIRKQIRTIKNRQKAGSLFQYKLCIQPSAGMMTSGMRPMPTTTATAPSAAITPKTERLISESHFLVLGRLPYQGRLSGECGFEFREAGSIFLASERELIPRFNLVYRFQKST
jgi:hypothetical protein